MNLGAYYWDGWYARSGNWTRRLMEEFTNRMPVWGWLGDSVPNMEMQVDLAANAGLGFFAFDWYYADGKHIGMNECVDRFLQSRNRGRMKQCLLVANHNPYQIYEKDWEGFCEQVIPYLTDETALTAPDGSPILIIFSGLSMIDHLGGPEKCSEYFEQLREKVRAKGLPGVNMMACLWPPRDELGAIGLDDEAWTACCASAQAGGYDSITGYNWHRDHKGVKPEESTEADRIYPFTALSADYELAWDKFAEHSKLPFMICVNGGWDCRPWESSERFNSNDGAVPSCYSPDRTPYTQYQHIRQAADWVAAHPESALSDLSIIYAWNENGEGGFIEPTIGDQGATLRAIAQALHGEDYI